MAQQTVYSSYLSKKYGARVFLQLEFLSKTGSYKDRLAKQAVKEALEKGYSKIAVMSSGNQGLAIAAAAKTADLECIVLAESGMRDVYKELIKKFGATLMFSKSMRARSAYYVSLIKQGYFPVTPTMRQRTYMHTNGISGYESIASEIFEKVGTSPDFLITSTSYGDGAMGMLSGFKKLKKVNKIRTIPTFILVRATEQDGNIAYSICTDVTTPQVRSVLRETNGRSIFLKNKDFRRAKRIAQDQLHLNIEISSGGPIIALEHLSQDGMLDKQSCVVLIITAGERV